MSDPFEALRGSRADVTAPSADLIRTRARRIERRRYAALGGGATVVAVIAAVGIFLGAEPGKPVRRSALSTPEAVSDASGTAGSAGSADVTIENRSSGKAGASVGGRMSSELAGASAEVHGDPAVKTTVTLEVKEGSLGQRGAELTLKVCSTAGIGSTDFYTTQRYDFEVSRDGELVWRWSNGKTFKEKHGSESYYECKSYTEHWDGMDGSGGPSPPGEYEAVGILTSSPQRKSEPKTFCLDLC